MCERGYNKCGHGAYQGLVVPDVGQAVELVFIFLKQGNRGKVLLFT